LFYFKFRHAPSYYCSIYLLYVSKGNKICFIYSFVIVIKILGEFDTIAAVRDPCMLDMDPGHEIMISETFVLLRVKSSNQKLLNCYFLNITYMFDI